MEFSMTEEKDLFSTDEDSISIDSNNAHLQRRFNLERRENTKKAAILELDLDLDEFNAMNTNSFSDSEELLRQIGERLKLRLRDNDVVLPVTNDKFMVLLEDIQSPDNADNVANELLNLLTRPYELTQNNDVKIGTKIGISFFSNPDEQEEETNTPHN